MTNLKDLWSRRFRQLAKELGKYSRLIFNDHFSVILFVMLGFLMFYYREQLVMLHTVDSAILHVPMSVIASILVAIVSQIGRPLWLMKDADKSFVYAQGKAWLSYWLIGSFVGMILPIIINILLAVLLYPFLALTLEWAQAELVMWILLCSMLVVGNHLLYYLILFGLSNQWRVTFTITSTLLLMISLLSFPKYALIILLTSIGLVIIGMFYLIFQNKKIWFDFELAQKIDNERKSALYRGLSFFVDIPQQTVSVTRRAFLDKCIQHLSHFSQNRYDYLFIRLLFRNKMYSGIWLRILLFMSVMMVLTNNLYLIIGLGTIAFYMTVVQLLPMIHYYDANPFQRIYPVKTGVKTQAIQYVTFIVLVIQGLVFFIVSLFVVETIKALVLLIVLTVMIMLIIYFYIPFWIKRNELK